MSKQSNQRYRKEKDKKLNTKYDNISKNETTNRSGKSKENN